MSAPDARALIEDLYGEYGALLDSARYDAWTELFEEGCPYVVVARDNHERGLPVALIRCDNLDMLRDRLTALSSANEYNIHWSRRILGRPRIRASTEFEFDVQCTYLAVQTNQEGQSRLFSAGVHSDLVKVTDGVARFVRKHVIVDTFCVPTLLATPL